ncbi:MAG TPA: hypothetical protein VIL52_04115 [Bacteroidota bacterium]
MAKRKRKNNVTIQEIVKKIEAMGGHEITGAEKHEPWYQEHLKQLERWRKEEVGKPFTVREKQALYGTKPQKKSPSKA